MANETVIKGGTVYDGTGAQGVRADVGIAGGRITEVGPNLDGDRVPRGPLGGQVGALQRSQFAVGGRVLVGRTGQVDEVQQRAGREPLLEPGVDLGRGPARVEPAAKRRRAEPADPGSAAGLLVGEQSELAGDPVRQRSGGDRGEVGLDDDLLHRRREQLDQVGR